MTREVLAKDLKPGMHVVIEGLHFEPQPYRTRTVVSVEKGKDRVTVAWDWGCASIADLDFPYDIQDEPGPRAEMEGAR